MKKINSVAAFGTWPSIALICAAMQFSLLLPLRAATQVKQITDEAITAAVETGLLFERGVFPNGVDVTAKSGIVTLSGSVDNILAKRRAVTIGESVRGVRGVIDLITVAPRVARPDEDIRKDVQTALRQDPATENYKVAVSVKDAVATLTGNVGSYLEEQLAAQIAESVKGIKEVRNEVTVNYSSKRTDQEIYADVKHRLQWDIWVNGDMIFASVHNGKVTLSGTVGSALGKSRALNDAWVTGVSSVDNSAMNVDPWGRNETRKKLKYATASDSQIKQAVIASLDLDPRVSAFAPGVTVENGEVRLSGVIGNLKGKLSAEQDAKNVVGVWLVDNFLKIRPTERPADAEIRTQLINALFWDALLDGDSIGASVSNRVAELSGSVGSSLEKAEAEDVASRTKGVLLVRNHLKVEPEVSVSYYNLPYYSDYNWISPLPHLSDEQIKANIENGLFWRPYVNLDDIKVTVDGGVATLTGSVGTWVGWSEINNVAYGSGAFGVVNRVKVNNGAYLLP